MAFVGGRHESFGSKILGGLGTAAKVIGTAHTVYKVGKAAWDVGRAIAPVAAALL